MSQKIIDNTHIIGKVIPKSQPQFKGMELTPFKKETAYKDFHTQKKENAPQFISHPPK
jgi:hypothetical protein